MNDCTDAPQPTGVEAARAAILAHLAHGPARLTDLREVTGLASTEYYLKQMHRAGMVARHGFHYRLPEAPQAEVGVGRTAQLSAAAAELLADLRPHRLREMQEALGGTGSTMRHALRALVDSGQALRIAKGVYLSAAAAPDSLPVSTADPMRLTPGESRCMRYLMQRLVCDQVVDTDSLESLASMLEADQIITRAAARARVAQWLHGLVAKGRVEVRQRRVLLLRDVDGARIRLSIAGLDDEDDDEEVKP